MRRSPGYNQTKYRCLSQCLKLVFARDCRRQCATAGTLAKAKLTVCNTRETCTIVISWYSHASGQPHTPSLEDTQRVTDEYVNLYTKEASPDAIPILLLASFDTSDEVPDNNKNVEAVKQLRNRKTPGPAKIK